jgi:hypothetical protein
MEQMLSAPVVPLTFIEGITPSDSETLAEHGIETIEQLAEATVDDICDWLDLSVDEAEDLLVTAQEIAEARRERLAGHPDEPEDAAYEEDYVDESGEGEATDEVEAEEVVEFGALADAETLDGTAAAQDGFEAPTPATAEVAAEAAGVAATNNPEEQ